jgi:pimeloyl-ACP methyl ester carboxylesterase
MTRSSRRVVLLALAFALPIVRAANAAQPTIEEVRFPSGPGTTLAGSLEKPAAPRRGPAVVIVAGTGPWVRGGFEKLRGRLLSEGIGVLQYDKRGQGRSTGAFIDTIPAMEEDVAAAVAYLRTRRDIDPERVGLLGHSQGAVAVPAVAARDPRVAAVAALSGPVGARGDLFLTILRTNLRDAGKPPAAIEDVVAAVARWMDARSAGAPAGAIAQARAEATRAFASVGLDEGALAALDNPVVLSMYEAAPDRALAAIKAPVIVVYGASDEVIAPAPSAVAATAALARNPDALVVTVPGAIHVLAPAPPIDRGPGDHMMPAVVNLLGDWFSARLRP